MRWRVHCNGWDFQITFLIPVRNVIVFSSFTFLLAIWLHNVFYTQTLSSMVLRSFLGPFPCRTVTSPVHHARIPKFTGIPCNYFYHFYQVHDFIVVSDDGLANLCGFHFQASFNSSNKSSCKYRNSRVDITRISINSHQQTTMPAQNKCQSILNGDVLYSYSFFVSFRINVYDFLYCYFQMPKKCLHSYIMDVKERERTHVKLGADLWINAANQHLSIVSHFLLRPFICSTV